MSIQFHNSLVGVVFDRFGLDVPVMETDEEHFVCRVKVAVSNQFLSWVMSFGEKAKIISPENVVTEIRELAKVVSENYR